MQAKRGLCVAHDENFSPFLVAVSEESMKPSRETKRIFRRKAMSRVND